MCTIMRRQYGLVILVRIESGNTVTGGARNPNVWL